MQVTDELIACGRVLAASPESPLWDFILWTYVVSFVFLGCALLYNYRQARRNGFEGR